MANRLDPLHVFQFKVEFKEDSLPGANKPETALPSLQSAFSECSGLEATMEPKVINVGGLNYGAVQRPGPVTFGTVILKRGITPVQDLWAWFHVLNGEDKYAYRVTATITLRDAKNKDQLKWVLQRAMPIKFKVPDLNATGSDVGIEELHLAHEGITLEFPTNPDQKKPKTPGTANE